MITCTLKDKKYSVDFISGRALREMGPAMEAYAAMQRAGKALKTGSAEGLENVKIADIYDALVRWFCLIFGNQFTPDEVYDHYPADRLISDVILAMLAVQTGATEVLSEFPTKAATGKAAEKS